MISIPDYLVTAVNTATTLTVQYKGGGADPTTAIATDRKVSPTGPAGTDGASSITQTTASFTMPAVNDTVTVPVANSSGFNTGINVDIATAGNFTVTAIASNPDTITVRNLGGNNTAVGVNIAIGSQVVITGPPGLDGSVTGASYLNYTAAIPPPPTDGNEWKDFIDSSNGNKRSLRYPGNGAIDRYFFFSDLVGLDGRGFKSNQFVGINFLVENGTYTLLTIPSGEPNWTIDLIQSLKVDTSCDFSLQIDTTAVTGMDAIALASDTPQNLTATGNNVATPEQEINIVITGLATNTTGTLIGTMRIIRG